MFTLLNGPFCLPGLYFFGGKALPAFAGHAACCVIGQCVHQQCLVLGGQILVAQVTLVKIKQVDLPEVGPQVVVQVRQFTHYTTSEREPWRMTAPGAVKEE